MRNSAALFSLLALGGVAAFSPGQCSAGEAAPAGRMQIAQPYNKAVVPRIRAGQAADFPARRLCLHQH